MEKSYPEVLIWDLETPPPVTDATLILWGRANFARNGVVSIPELVEEKAEYYRKEYLAWVHKVGEFEAIQGSVISQLELKDNFSYWWMTLFVEKCNFAKSPQIADAIKLMALNDWIISKDVKKILIASRNKNLVTCLLSFGKKFRIQVLCDRTHNKNLSSLSWGKRIQAIVPMRLQACGWLFFRLIRIIPLYQIGVKEWRNSNADLTFISYFCNFSTASAQKGIFESLYWDGLPKKLISDGFIANWLHLFVVEKNRFFFDALNARKNLKSINANSNNSGQSHVLLESFLTLGVIFKVLRTWSRIGRIEKSLSDSLNQHLGGNVWIAPLFKDDWARSFHGPVAVSNLMYFYLLERALGFLDSQKIGIYLQENQSWEFALIHIWKSKSHGMIIGAPHATIRFWDLRYYFDTKEYLKRRIESLPLPDKVAVNGNMARHAYESSGYPPELLVNVEALRFMHILEKNNRINLNKNFTVLVLGDYLELVSQQQLDLLEKSMQNLPPFFQYIYRAHPRCPIKKNKYLEMVIDWSNSKLEDLLDACDVVYTGSMTSAAVDAYCRGIPVISTLDHSGLNISPLRGADMVYFVENSKELTFAILDIYKNPKAKIFVQDLFCVDAGLTRWSRLLRQTF